MLFKNCDLAIFRFIIDNSGDKFGSFTILRRMIGKAIYRLFTDLPIEYKNCKPAILTLTISVKIVKYISSSCVVYYSWSIMTLLLTAENSEQ